MSERWPLRDYYLWEARRSARRTPVVVAVAGILSVLLSHALIPRLPPRAIGFMEEGMRLHGVGEVLLANDIVAIYFASFFVGISGLSEVLISAREEGRLELLLAKPVKGSTFLWARAMPALAASLAVGLAVSTATAFLVSGPAFRRVTFAGAMGAGLFVTALALVDLALLAIVFVRMRDGFSGLLIGAALWTAGVMPSAVLIYRPDFFSSHPGLADATVVSSLVWHADVVRWLGPSVLLLAFPLVALALRIAARRLERGDL